MVIVINEKNQQLYNDFFIKSYKFAVENDIIKEGSSDYGQNSFLDLWQYYKYLPQLGAIDSTFYTKLPLDEPMMEINGDSREIKVPAQLAKCAGIQGDHMAESIMFIIDRYHDGKDLANAQIWIQWKTEDGTEGRTAVPHKDFDFAKEKIRFPWPLTKDITEHPGVVEFSAVFFMMIEGQNSIAYRYATLPAKIKIAEALLEDLGNNAIDAGSGFAVTVKTSSYGPGFYVPVNPTFGDAQFGLDLDETSDLIYSGTSDTAGSLMLKAQATVTDSGEVKYDWVYRAPTDTNGQLSTVEFKCGVDQTKKIPAGTVINLLEAAFINAYATKINSEIVSDTNKVSVGKIENDLSIEYNFGVIGIEKVSLLDKSKTNPFDIYYDTEDDKPVTQDQIKASDSKKSYYEKYTTFTLPSSGPVTGFYFATAVNEIKTEDSENPNKSEKVKSTTTELISPEGVEFVSDVTFSTEVFSDGQVSLDTKLKKKLNEGYVIKLYKDDESSEVSTLDTDTAIKEIEILPTDNIVPKIEVTKTDDDIGWYRAKVIARRNRETKEALTKTWRVIEPVAAPQIINNTNINSEINKNSITGAITTDSTDVYYYKVEVRENLPVELSVGIKDGNNIRAISDYYTSSGRVKALLTDNFTCKWERIEADKITPLVSDDYNSSSYTYEEGIKTNETVIIRCTFTNTLAGMNESKSVTFRLE